MQDNANFADKKILLIDREQKNTNDRTWCFWEKGNGYFQSCVSKEWSELIFKHGETNIQSNINPYKYKLVRSANLYAYCQNKIAKNKNIIKVVGEITQIDTKQGSVSIGDTSYFAEKIFSSILLQEPLMQANNIFLLQHFKGYFIKSKEAVFKPDVATIMDFSVSQAHGASFVYTLPFSKNTALVEYTLFTESLLEPEQYKEALQEYISKDLGITDYEITEEEFGVIPMTNYAFTNQENNTYYIGTSGGATKASSGYTFTFVQKQADALIQALLHNKALQPVHKKRYNFFDDILLYLIETRKLGLDKIFLRLFQKNSMPSIFKFLDEDASILENIKTCGSLQIIPFAKAAFQRIFK